MTIFSRNKRVDLLPLEAVQQGNQQWWERHTMSYDWDDEVQAQRLSATWFDEIDRRFIESARLYGHDQAPFDRLIPFEQLRGKRVLEIGCGMGLHSELMVRAGAQLTAVDLSRTSVDSTRARLELKGLQADVLQADAENLPFPDGHFDFVWSWGVIHHSAHTGRIVRQISRVLAPEGECRVMVYNRDSAYARYVFLWKYLMRAQWLRRSYDETLNASTDGFTARFYPPEQFGDLFRTFFGDVRVEVMGQESDAVPLPRPLRRLVAPLVDEATLRRNQARWGYFIFVTARSLLR